MIRASAAAVAWTIVLVIPLSVAGCNMLGNRTVQFHAPTLDATPQSRGLRGQFFGATTVLIRDDKNAIMIDGFFSRPGFWRLLLARLEPDLRRIDEELDRADVSTIDYVLVSHSHHDHAMDAPIVAKKTHATLVGSESTHKIALGSTRNVPFHPARAGEQLHAGRFTITLFESAHAPYRFEDSVRRSSDIADPLREFLDRELAGEIREPLVPPARFTQYKVGLSYVFLVEHPQGRILVVPSAAVPVGLGDINVDVVLLSIGDADKLSNEHITRYWKEAVANTGAKLVIPIHWDNLSGLLGESLTALPSFVDNAVCALDTLTFLNASRAVIKFMPLREAVPFDVTQVYTIEHASSTALASTVNPFKDGCRKGRE